MRIEVLYTPGCPNHKPVVERIRKLLRSESLDAAVQEIAITEERVASAMEFPGSPTVRVNGRDVEEGGEQPALACRLYAGGEGMPSEESLRRALRAAHRDATR